MLGVSIMKIKLSKIQFIIFPLAFLFFSLLALPVRADLLDKNKSDSTIKMLVFPQSLRVVENQVNGKTGFPDQKRIRKTLLKIDPTRVVPAKAGKPFKGPVTRDSLRLLSKQYSEDVIFIFRRKLDSNKNSIRHQGLLYLAKQKKVLALKESSGSGGLQEMDMKGLKNLAKEAKRVLHSHKFEKRQSAY